MTYQADALMAPGGQCKVLKYEYTHAHSQSRVHPYRIPHQLTRPTVINEIHRRYFEAGADICETNTFSGTWVAQADYGLEHMVYDINYKAAKLCKMAAMEVEKATGRRKFCAGNYFSEVVFCDFILEIY